MKRNPSSKIVIFTDLDGTLLDHETYSYAAALPALGVIKERGIPLIMASSKTAAEIEPLRAALGFSHCHAIVENGAGVMEPFSGFDENTATYDKILRMLESLPPEVAACFTGFNQMSLSKLSELTGLDSRQAELARARQFSEPGIWDGTKDLFIEFEILLNDMDLIVQQGGRFISVSYGANKAARMQQIVEHHLVTAIDTFSVALGDAPNDVDMLQTADLGVIIPNKSHNSIQSLAGEIDGSIVRASADGPAGWNASVLQILMNESDVDHG